MTESEGTMNGGRCVSRSESEPDSTDHVKSHTDAVASMTWS